MFRAQPHANTTWRSEPRLGARGENLLRETDANGRLYISLFYGAVFQKCTFRAAGDGRRYRSTSRKSPGHMLVLHADAPSSGGPNYTRAGLIGAARMSKIGRGEMAPCRAVCGLSSAWATRRQTSRRAAPGVALFSFFSCVGASRGTEDSITVASVLS